MWNIVKTIPLLIAVILMFGCGDLTDAPPPQPPPPPPVLEIPTDGTWDYGDYPSSSAAGFGKWSAASGAGANFDFMIDTPPSITQEGTALVVESQVHVRRAEENPQFDDALGELRAKFVPGVSMFKESGGGALNYDEVYGETKLVCPVDNVAVGETTTCTISFVEKSPDWVADSYWLLKGVSVAAWPSQITTAGD